MRIRLGVLALVLSVTLPSSIHQTRAQDRSLVSSFNGWPDIHCGWPPLAGQRLVAVRCTGAMAAR